MVHTIKIKILFSILIAAVSGFFLMSCENLFQDPEEEPILGYEDLYEPNNEAQEATEVVLGLPIQAAIQAKGDKDYYTFLVPDSLPGEGYVMGTLSPFPGTPHLTFYNEQKQRYGTQYNYSSTKGADLSGWISVIPGKRYYVKVNNRYSSSTHKDPYTLHLQYVPIIDPYEPNNSIDEATEAELGSVYQAYLFKAETNEATDYRDYYKFTLPTEGNITVSLTSFPTNIAPQFWVYGANGEPISRYNYSSTNGASLVKTIEGVKAGVIYIAVNSYFSARSIHGTGNELPDNMTNMYSFQVTME